MKLPINEYPPFFEPYLAMVEEDVLHALKVQLEHYTAFMQSIPEDKHLFRYAPNKWTIKEVVGHVTDTERLKSTVAFRIARKDTASLPGFDEDAYVLATDFNARSMDSLLAEFVAVRKSTIQLCASLREEEMKRIGFASNAHVSTRALLYFCVAHALHHENILKERYLGAMDF